MLSELTKSVAATDVVGHASNTNFFFWYVLAGEGRKLFRFLKRWIRRKKFCVSYDKEQGFVFRVGPDS